MERAKVTVGGLFATFTMLYATALIFPPSALAEISRQDGWIAVLLAVVWALGALGLALWARPAGVTGSMPAWIEAVLGTLLGRMVNVSLLGYFTLSLALDTRQALTVVQLVALPETPPWAVAGLAGIPLAVAVRLGIEDISRTSQAFLALIVIAYIMLGMTIGATVDPARALPVGGTGFQSILLASVIPAAFFSKISFVLWMAPYALKRRDLRRAGAGAVVLTGMFVFAIVFLAEGVFGFREMQRMLMPALNLVRAVRLGDVVQRMEIIYINIWFLGVFMKSALFGYLACMQLAWVMGARHYRHLVLPVVAMTSALSFVLFDNVVRMADFMTIGAFIPYTFAHTVGVPILLLVALGLRKLMGQPPRIKGDEVKS